MTQRLAILSNDVDDAASVVETLRLAGYADDDIYVITRDDIILEDLPEADPRQYSDLLPALKRGAGMGGALGLFGGLLMATIPPAGLAASAAAVTAMTAGGAAFGAWTSSLFGISVPNSRLEEFPGVEVHGGVDAGKLIVTVEDAEGTTAADTMMAFNSVEGVITSTLIYHYGGDDLDEEVTQ